MKALYLDINIKYHNPNRNMIPFILKNIFDKVDIYGPGYVSKQVLKNGLESYFQLNGPYDFIISNEMIIYADKGKFYEEPSKSAYIGMYHIKFEQQLLNKKVIMDMHNFFINDDKHQKVAFLWQLDFYNISESDILKINDIKNLFLVTFGKDLIAPKIKLETLKNEAFYEKANDNWYDFVTKEYKKIISLPHFIDDRDCEYTPIESRKYDINIPGVNYWYRKEVLKSLSKSYTTPSKIHMKIYSLLNKLKLKPFSFLIGNDIYNYIFRKSIAYSKITITCGSGLQWPLNKFFEIPAEGSLLICYPFFNQENLGFVHNETCMVVKKPKEINQMIQYCFSNIIDSQKVATKGQQMVIKNHSIDARIKQIKMALEVINDNVTIFNGAFWEKGNFKVNSTRTVE